jgi:RNA polymerase sigma factor (sigma-70 family)
VSRAEDIFKRLYDERYDEVHAFCARRVGLDDADDAAADVFAVAWRRIDEVQPETARGWIFGVARKVVLNQWRSRSRRARLVERVGGSAVRRSEGPDVVVVRRSEDDAVVAAIEQLRPVDREVIELAAWEELSGPEIAQVLGISTQAAQQRLHRAKRRLAKRLAAIPGLGKEERDG